MKRPLRDGNFIALGRRPGIERSSMCLGSLGSGHQSGEVTGTTLASDLGRSPIERRRFNPTLPAGLCQWEAVPIANVTSEALSLAYISAKVGISLPSRAQIRSPS